MPIGGWLATIEGRIVERPIELLAVGSPQNPVTIGFLGGLTGALFREFAFTLAGSVIVSG